MSQAEGDVSRRVALALVGAAAVGVPGRGLGDARAASDMDQTGIARDVDRIARWVAVCAPETELMFRPGARAGALTEAERRLGVSLPAELRTLYAHADGQPEAAPTVSDAFYLMPLTEAVEAALFLNDFFPEGRNEEHPDHAPIDADPGIRPTWWWKNWMPVFSNGSGDYYCVDLDPAPGGAAGQVVSYWHDETFRSLVAGSPAALFAAIADGLEAGTYELKYGMISKRTG